MHRKGFTLVELAIVLLVAGFLIGGGLTATNSWLNSTRYSSVKINVEAAIKAVAEYSGRAQMIPATGNLGTAVTKTKDSHGNAFHYQSATALSSAYGAICNTDKTTLTVRECDDATCSSSTDRTNIAYFISSNSINETREITLTSTTEIRIYNDTIINGYDDVTGWVTLDALKKYAGCEELTMEIAERKLPPLYYFYDKGDSTNFYDGFDFDLHPIGGISSYQWCVESSNENVRSYLKYGANNLAEDCTNSYINANSGGDIKINAADAELDDTDKLPISSKLTVYLKDSNGNIVARDYLLVVKEAHSLGYTLSEPSTVIIPPVTGGSVDNVTVFMNNPTGSGTGNSDYLTIDSDDDGVYDGIKILQSADTDAISAFYGCESAENSTPCPEFGNKGILTAYFTAEFYHKTSHWRTPQGFTFAVLRSVYEDKNSTTYSTESAVGDSNSGLGYGGYDGDHYENGITGGNSFAVEFDVYQNTTQEDPDDDHISILSYVNINDYNGSWVNGSQVGYTYSTYGNNIHTSTGDGTGWTTTFNDTCTTTRGDGCYYSTTEDVIPNTHDDSDNLFGVRIEAISGCNSDGSVCNKQTGADNHICVYMWKEMKTAMDADTTLDSDMRNVTTSHIYNNITLNTTIPLGTPLVKDCIVDDTTTRNHLDKIRFGFTSGAGHTGQNQFYFELTNLSVNVGAY